MIYPKISQRYLAMVVLCLLLTLGSVGVSFLIYFFNKPFVLNTVHAKAERYEILLPQRLSMSKSNIERDKKIQYHNNDSNSHIMASVGGIKPLDILTQLDMVKHSKYPTLYRVVSDNENDDISTAEKKFRQEEDTDQQNIYIDELDKPIVQVEDRMSSPYKYFSSDNFTSTEANRDDNMADIISPFSNGRTILQIHRLQSESQRNTNKDNLRLPKTGFQKQELKKHKQAHPFTNSDQVYDSHKKKNYDIVIESIKDENNSNDDEDNPDSGSGSGDFDLKVASHGYKIGVYDDGTSNFIRRISLKMLQTYGHKGNSNRYNFLNKSRKIKPVTVRGNTKQKRLKENIYKKALQFSHSIESTNTENMSMEQLNHHKSSIQNGPVLNLHKTSNGAIINMTASSIKQTRTMPTIAIKESGLSTTNYFGYNNRLKQQQQIPHSITSKSLSPTWLETRTRRIIGNVKKSEERSRQLLLCEKEEAGGGELCRMLFKGHLND